MLHKLINKIKHYAITNPATVYDEDATTALDLAARTAAKVNECIDVVNEHLTDCDKKHKEQDGRISDAEKYMKENIIDIAKTLYDQAVARGEFDTIPLETYAKLTGGVFNVKEFGAEGDGINDDHEYIQAAIDAAKQVEGSTVYLPAGHYHISDPLIVYSHTRLIGSGKRGISDTGFSGTQISSSSSYAIRTDPNASAIYGAELRDLRVSFDGSEPGTIGILFNNCSECYMHNVSVNGYSEIGIRYEGTIAHLDNLYLAGNQTGLQLFNAHGVTVSNLNAWENTWHGIEISGNCCGNDIRDSWIENSEVGIAFTDQVGSLVCYNTTVQSTTYTVGADFGDPKFIKINDFNQLHPFLVQGLRVIDCVAKISDGGTAIMINTSRYTTTAEFANCRFLGSSPYTYAIDHRGKFDTITMSNNACADYEGNNYPIIGGGGGNHFTVNTKSQYTEFVSDRPIRLPLATDIQTMAGGQVYYKDGHLKVTDGSAARTIPNQGAAVSASEATTVEELRSSFNNLITVLKDAKVIQ